MSISHISFQSVEALADHYARSRTDRSKPISITTAIRAVRMVKPAESLSDHELASIIAATAVQYGYAVDFDIEPAVGA